MGTDCKCLKIVLSLCYLCFSISFAYNLSCPDPSQWSTRARLLCPDPSKYYCLWDGNADAFKENCSKVDLTRPGERLVILYNFDSKFCRKDVYQPYIHWTNESSGCKYKKSLCGEEGQVVYDDTNTKQDVKCACDSTRGYDFITTPANPCYCIPAEEDCSCFLNSCLANKLLSDLRCPDKLIAKRNCLSLKRSREENSRLDLETNNQTMNTFVIKQGRVFANQRNDQMALGLVVCITFLLALCCVIVRFWATVKTIVSGNCRQKIDEEIPEEVEIDLNESLVDIWRKVYVTSPLVHMEVDEGQKCKLQCILSESNTCDIWLKDGIPITKTSNIAITFEDLVRTLTIDQMSEEYAGEYELRCGIGPESNTMSSVTVKPVTAVKPLVNMSCFDSETCTLQCEISVTNSPVYWTKNGKFIVGTNNVNKTFAGCVHTLTIKQMSRADEGQYELRIGERTITESYIRFKSVFIRGLDSKECIEGNSVTLMCKVSENDMVAKWYKEVDEIRETQNIVIENEDKKHRLKIINPIPSDSGIYIIEVKSLKQKATLNVKAFVKTHLVNTVIIEGFHVCLSCKTERPGIHANWYKDENILEQSENIQIEESHGIHKLTIFNAKLEHKGKYRIDIEGFSSEAFLDVREMPQVLKKMSRHDRNALMEMAKVGTAPRYHIRIMIVGENGVGKTCLLRRILNEEIDDFISNDSLKIEVRKCTIDLETGMWTSNEDESNKLTNWKREHVAYCRFWDFAGQKEYYATHQMFLSSNAIYILAVDLSKNWTRIASKHFMESEFATMGENIEFWLDNIHCYVGDTNIATKGRQGHLSPSVIIVGTGTDKFKENSLQEAVKNFENFLDELLGNELKRQHIQNRLYLSNISPDKTKFMKIRDIILEIANKMPKWGEELPIHWILLENHILNLKENVVSYADIRSIAVECTFPADETDAELDAFLEYEHELGNILFFDKVKEYIVLNPDWLINALRCLVAPEQFQSRLMNLVEMKRTGKISIQNIDELFERVPEFKFLENKPFLLKVMEAFDILVKSPFNTSVEYYFIPCMMNTSTFEKVCRQLGVTENKCKRSSWLCIDFDFLPPGFFNHVLVTYTTRYCVVMESGSKPALYRNIGIFNLIENGCQKMVLCVTSYTIAMQIWNWSITSEQYYGDHRTELLNIVNTVQQRCRIHIKYTVYLKCSKGNVYQSCGKINYKTLLNSQTYYCDEHHELHKNVDVYSSWFKSSQKEQANEVHSKKDKENKDTRFGKRCTTCDDDPSEYWCYECQQSYCDSCYSQHHGSDHCVQHVYDKYKLADKFSVNIRQIEDIKLESEGLLCISDFYSKQLVMVDLANRAEQFIPLPSKPFCIAVIDSSTVAVTSITMVIMVDIRQFYIMRQIDVIVKCYGIMYSNEQLYVGCKDSTIKVLSMSGEVMRSIPVHFIPYNICSSDNGVIYCLESNNLHYIDSEGKLLSTFTDPVMDKPQSITTNDKGQVFVVCYRSNNILNINYDAKKCEVIVKHIAKSDWSPYICFIPQKKAIVVGREKNVSVFQLI